MKRKNIIVFRDHLLPSSETFIRAQVENLTDFQPIYVGSKQVKGLELPSDKIVVLNKGGSIGRIKELLFKLTGFDFGLSRELEKKFDPQLVHAYFGMDGLESLPLARKMGLPLVVSFLGYDATVQDQFAKNYLHKKYVRERKKLQTEATKFIAASNFIKSKMIEQGYDEEKIIQHYIGINTDLFKVDPLILREPIVLFVGRLVRNKGAEYLIKAMREVQKVYPEAELVVIGDGPLRKELEDYSATHLKRYRFLGTQPQSEVKKWMNRSKVFSVPSITIETGASEGFGMVFVEANAMGLPVVSFATGGIVESVAHNQTGFLAPEKDIEMLTKYLIQLLEDDALWSEFSRTGIDRVHNLFDIRKQTQRLEMIYDQILTSTH